MRLVFNIFFTLTILHSALSQDDPLALVSDDYFDREPDNTTEYPNGVNTIPGEAGIDYPIYTFVPRTSFECRGRPAGFYADTTTRCQLWHICDPMSRQQSFLCPNGTVYSQTKRVCDWWFNVNCEEAEVNSLYERNKDLFLGPPSKEELDQQNHEAPKNKVPRPDKFQGPITHNFQGPREAPPPRPQQQRIISEHRKDPNFTPIQAPGNVRQEEVRQKNNQRNLHSFPTQSYEEESRESQPSQRNPIHHNSQPQGNPRFNQNQQQNFNSDQSQQRFNGNNNNQNRPNSFNQQNNFNNQNRNNFGSSETEESESQEVIHEKNNRNYQPSNQPRNQQQFNQQQSHNEPQPQRRPPQQQQNPPRQPQGRKQQVLVKNPLEEQKKMEAELQARLLEEQRLSRVREEVYQQTLREEIILKRMQEEEQKRLKEEARLQRLREEEDTRRRNIEAIERQRELLRAEKLRQEMLQQEKLLIERQIIQQRLIDEQNSRVENNNQFENSRSSSSSEENFSQQPQTKQQRPRPTQQHQPQQQQIQRPIQQQQHQQQQHQQKQHQQPQHQQQRPTQQQPRQQQQQQNQQFPQQQQQQRPQQQQGKQSRNRPNESPKNFNQEQEALQQKAVRAGPSRPIATTPRQGSESRTQPPIEIPVEEQPKNKFRHSTPRKHNVKFANIPDGSREENNRERQIRLESQHQQGGFPIPNLLRQPSFQSSPTDNGVNGGNNQFNPIQPQPQFDRRNQLKEESSEESEEDQKEREQKLAIKLRQIAQQERQLALLAQQQRALLQQQRQHQQELENHQRKSLSTEEDSESLEIIPTVQQPQQQQFPTPRQVPRNQGGGQNKKQAISSQQQLIRQMNIQPTLNYRQTPQSLLQGPPIDEELPQVKQNTQENSNGNGRGMTKKQMKHLRRQKIRQQVEMALRGPVSSSEELFVPTTTQRAREQLIREELRQAPGARTSVSGSFSVKPPTSLPKTNLITTFRPNPNAATRIVVKQRARNGSLVPVVKQEYQAEQSKNSPQQLLQRRLTMNMQTIYPAPLVSSEETDAKIREQIIGGNVNYGTRN